MLIRRKATSSVVNQDLPNGDLVVGDNVIITKWCRNKAYVKVVVGPVGIQETVSEQEADTEEKVTRPNSWLFHEITTIIAIDRLPDEGVRFLVEAINVNGSKSRHLLDARDFECRRPDPAFAKAFTYDWVREAQRQATAPDKPRTSVRVMTAIFLILGIIGLGKILGTVMNLPSSRVEKAAEVAK